MTRIQRVLKHVVGENVLRKNAELSHYSDNLLSASRRRMLKESDRLQLNENVVRLLNPVNVLKRGFTLTLKDGEIVKSVKQLHAGEELETRFKDGQVKSKITKLKNNDS